MSHWPLRSRVGVPTDSSRPVPGADISLMGARAARAGVMLRQVESLPKLQEIVAKAVLQHATDHEYLTELTTWSGRYGSLAGSRHATFRNRIRQPWFQAASSLAPRWLNQPTPNRQTTAQSWWPLVPGRMTSWRAYVLAKRPVLYC